MAGAVRVGIIGAGFAANIHARSYQAIGNVDLEVVGVADSRESIGQAFAERYDIPHVYQDAQALIDRDDLNLIDVCVPNRLHERFVLAAARAGKHVVCEKPLTGYFGGDEAADPVGATPKSVMFQEAVASAQRMVRAGQENGVKVMYAENWLYSPALLRAARLAEASGGTILEIRARECHSGSHASYAKAWEGAGGGALVRLGSHPLGAALWLKQAEGLWRDGAAIKAASVVADVGDLTRVASFRAESDRYLVDGWHDVENWSVILITFDDGTRALIEASDIVLGGMEDRMDLLLSNCRIRCDLTHSGLLTAYAPTDAVFGDEYIQEKVSTKAGWSYPSFEEEYLLGYRGEIRDFVESVAFDREPRSTAQIGLEVVRVMYAAYQSAEEGRRIEL